MPDFAAWIGRLTRAVTAWRYGITPATVLNAGPMPPGPPQAVRPLAAELRAAMLRVKAQAITEDGRRVDYAALRASPAYADYRHTARRLQAFDPADLETDAERLAFWINLYNALMVDAVIDGGVPGSVAAVPGFFWRAAYRVGGRRYSAFDIEHGILRANRGHPAIPGPQFAPGDPRRAYGVRHLDPRIHFALVCAARSCPPIAVYEVGQIEAQLELAARAFVNGGGVQAAAGEARLSQIFQWYAPDFGGPPLGRGDMGPVLRRVAAWVDDEPARARLAAGGLPTRFLPYDWALNA